MRSIKDGSILLHRAVLKLKPGDSAVDHINSNPLDNRKCNLRLATPSQNAVHAKRRKRNGKSTTEFRGVIRETRFAKDYFYARIRVNQKPRNLGTFSTAREAALAYDNAAKEYHGVFAMLNFPIHKIDSMMKP